MKTRSGVSLAELLVVMSGCTVVLTISAALMHRVMHAQRATRALYEVERTSLRLAGQFRQDVRQAENAAGDAAELGDAVVLRLNLPGDQIVEYRNDDAGLLRILTAEEKVVARETFAFPPGCEVSVEPGAEPSRLLTLSITSSPATTRANDEKFRSPVYDPPVRLQVVAALGRDAPLTPREEETE